MNVSTKTPSALEERGLKISVEHLAQMQRKYCDPAAMRLLNKDDQIAAYRLRIGELERIVKLRDETIEVLRGAE